MGQKLFDVYPHLKTLDKFSKRVAKQIYKRHPYWFDSACIEFFEENPFLLIELNSLEIPERAIKIYTLNQRITFSFDLWHTHFDSPDQSNSDIENLFEFLNDFFNEKLVLGIKNEAGKYKMGRIYEVNDIHRIPSGEVSLLKSWKGNYDRKL